MNGASLGRYFCVKKLDSVKVAEGFYVSTNKLYFEVKLHCVNFSIADVIWHI